MDSFEQIGQYLFRCKTCGKEVESGIVNISRHWNECTGKDFAEELQHLTSNEKLTTKKVDKLREKHFGQLPD